MQYEQMEKWIEAINLTLALPEDKIRLFDLIKQAKSSLANRQDSSMSVSLFRNIRTENNWSILLQRENCEIQPKKTNLGKNFARIVGKLGDVEHAVWKKQVNEISD